MRDIYLGLHRFDDIAENLGISRNLLTRRFRTLVADGVVERRAYQQRPLRHEYHLTAAGRELVPVLMALMAGGEQRATPAGGPPVRLVHEACGQHCTPQVCCSACGEAVDATGVTALSGPGAASGPGTTVLARRYDLPAYRNSATATATDGRGGAAEE